jgi:HAD superfamily hydrolase (TIGR01509 family)
VTTFLDPAGLLRRKRLLIFDFDGTVADTSPFHARAFSNILVQYGVAVDYPTIAGLRTLDAVRRLLEESGQTLQDAELAQLVSSKQRLVREMISCELLPLPGIDVFLNWARTQFVLAMASSGSRETVGLGLEKLGYKGLFSPLFCSEDVSWTKPNPEIFLKVLANTNISAGEAMVFEDSDAGLAAALSAGIDCYDVRSEGWLPWANVAG